MFSFLFLHAVSLMRDDAWLVTALVHTFFPRVILRTINESAPSIPRPRESCSWSMEKLSQITTTIKTTKRHVKAVFQWFSDNVRYGARFGVRISLGVWSVRPIRCRSIISQYQQEYCCQQCNCIGHYWVKEEIRHAQMAISMCLKEIFLLKALLF